MIPRICQRLVLIACEWVSHKHLQSPVPLLTKCYENEQQQHERDAGEKRVKPVQMVFLGMKKKEIAIG
jgi:hypothetical protein